jgi:hypothetical protein
MISNFVQNVKKAYKMIVNLAVKLYILIGMFALIVEKNKRLKKQMMISKKILKKLILRKLILRKLILKKLILKKLILKK